MLGIGPCSNVPLLISFCEKWRRVLQEIYLNGQVNLFTLSCRHAPIIFYLMSKMR